MKYIPQILAWEKVFFLRVNAPEVHLHLKLLWGTWSSCTPVGKSYLLCLISTHMCMQVGFSLILEILLILHHLSRNPPVSNQNPPPQSFSPHLHFFPERSNLLTRYRMVRLTCCRERRRREEGEKEEDEAVSVVCLYLRDNVLSPRWAWYHQITSGE